MADNERALGSNIDPLAPYRLLSTTTRMAGQSMRIAAGAIKRSGADGGLGMADPLGVQSVFMDALARLMANPVKLAGAQMELWLDYISLWQRASLRALGVDTDPLITPSFGDRRFRDEAWDDNAVFDMIKQAYLLTGRWLIGTMRAVEGLDDQTARKLEFFTQQIVDALSPSNFAATNPAVLRATLESGGKNLLDGLKNLLDDLERSGGRLDVRMTDMDAFSVGKNVAATPGKVVYQTDLMQLIQYAPATEKVARRPMLIVPPWMNKFYIMDLSPKNSMIKWLVDQGQTVFVISWVNPDERLAEKNFEDYLAEGPLAALDAIEQATGEREVNAVGYCLGGILLSAAVAYLSAKGDDRIHSGTYFTTMVDFSDVGDISVFIDEEQIESLGRRMRKQGYLDGQSVATTFRMLRSNDLIWSFFVNNYLLGQEPLPFDLLFWNSDSTRMPAAMHEYFIRNMYIHNRLREPGGVTLLGQPVDVRKVQTPAYILSTREDHIAPWKTTYATTQLFQGPVRFVLGASGHIAGVINPPEKQKYGYWVGGGNGSTQYPADADEWLGLAKEHKGSWWPDWMKWISRHDGGQVPARAPGEGTLSPIEDAPGSYVKVRADEPPGSCL